MVTTEILLEIETAYELSGGGEMSLPLQWFVRGGHYGQAFVLAVERTLAVEYSEVPLPNADLLSWVRHTHWSEIPDGEGGWEYIASDPRDENAFPVTYVYIGDIRDRAWYRCAHCWDDRHDDCVLRLSGTFVPLYDHQAGAGRSDYPLRKRRWTYNPRNF
jgi:hypothetical protein